MIVGDVPWPPLSLSNKTGPINKVEHFAESFDPIEGDGELAEHL